MFKRKLYKSNQPVVLEDGNLERVLLLIEEKEILYIPEFSKEYSFQKDTEVFEIILTEKAEKNIKAENMASPFFLTGDACFYHFMARKIKISQEQELYNKKGQDILWLVYGDLYLEKPGQEKRKFGDVPFIIEETGIVYKIVGQGEIFLLKK